MKRLPIFALCLLLTGSFFTYSCGGGKESGGCEPGAGDEGYRASFSDIIKIFPTDIEVKDSSLVPAPHTEYFSIRVTNDNGIPLSDVLIDIYYWLAQPDIYGVVQLYDCTTPLDAPFSAVTDENGTYYLRVDFLSGGLEYEGQIEVRSGAAVPAFADFTVKMED